MHDVTHETSSLIKAFGIMMGECLFGLYGPMLFMHPLSWFEINLPGAIAIGVLFGAAVGYGVATAALRLLRREAASGQQRRPMVASAQWAADLHA
jgi:hypothetical protein